MKVLSFRIDGRCGLGAVLDEDRIIDITAALRNVVLLYDRPVPESVAEMIALGDTGLAAVEQVAGTRDLREKHILRTQEIEILPPTSVRGRNVFCVGRNYKDHIIESNIAKGRPTNAFPTDIEFFTKSCTSLIGHLAPIARHESLTDLLDYEAELGIVIGREGTNIPRKEALAYVFGFTIVNDVTARDLQSRHGQWFKGKSLDKTSPIGPFVVHRSSVRNPNNLDVSLHVNGELRQMANTSSMLFDIETIIEKLSEGLTLYPGDVIATGTPKGVGFAMHPPQGLKRGDRIEINISEIGTLLNTVS